MTEEVTAAPADDTATTQADTPPARDYETEAREIGWQPEAEFKGDKTRWKPAEQFVKDGENFIPILKANERKLRLELSKEKTENAARFEKLARMNAATQERLQQQHEQEIERLKSAKDTAVEAGDKAEVRKIDAQIDKLREPIEIEQEQPGERPEIAEFKKGNSWYGTDAALTAYANAYSLTVPQTTIDENLRHVEAHMRERFPERYGNVKKPTANGHSAVDGGGSFNGAGSKADPLSKLPNEARSQCVADMKKFPTFFPTKESWIAKYEGKV